MSDLESWRGFTGILQKHLQDIFIAFLRLHHGSDTGVQEYLLSHPHQMYLNPTNDVRYIIKVVSTDWKLKFAKFYPKHGDFPSKWVQETLDLLHADAHLSTLFT